MTWPAAKGSLSCSFGGHYPAGRYTFEFTSFDVFDTVFDNYNYRIPKEKERGTQEQIMNPSSMAIGRGELARWAWWTVALLGAAVPELMHRTLSKEDLEDPKKTPQAAS